MWTLYLHIWKYGNLSLNLPHTLQMEPVKPLTALKLWWGELSAGVLADDLSDDLSDDLR